MTMSSERQSATIYDFAARLRATGRNFATAPKPAAPAVQVPAVDFGSGWYHDAAIQEPDRSRKQ